MDVKTETYDVGVLVGRFQVPELHDAHRDLINTVLRKHDKVIIILGSSPLWATKTNPLDFQARRQMIRETFPDADIEVLYIKDVHNDDMWSKQLDGPGQTAVLYGSRDSFLNHYTGTLPSAELESTVFVSGTEVRKDVARSKARNSSDFRAGIIWATQNRFPTSFPTVDVAVLNNDATKVLLAKKPNETKYRFIGGFADPKRSNSFEEDAIREVQEEAGIKVSGLEYLGSAKIDDWRYRGEDDKIKTLFFVAMHASGTPEPDDDIAELKWFSLQELEELAWEEEVPLIDEHLPLLAMLWDYFDGEEN
jgi:bifunctional NMN adenylyltransferase/nudix hydrolase